MLKVIVKWLGNVLNPPKSESEKRLIERYYCSFCKQLEAAPSEEQIEIKDLIVRMFLGVTVGDC